jgi:hypothetical protein
MIDCDVEARLAACGGAPCDSCGSQKANPLIYECTCKRCGETWRSSNPAPKRNCPATKTIEDELFLSAPAVSVPVDGPGTEFATIAEKLGYQTCGDCNAIKAGMNLLGVAGCEERFEEVLAAIRDNAGKHPKKFGKLIAAVNAARHGMTFIDPRDPLRSILVEAVRRAAEKEAAENNPHRAA